MILKAMNVCYNVIYIFMSLVSIFIFKFNRHYSSSNCQSKSRHVGKDHRPRFKPNLEPFERFRRAYWVNWNLEPVERYLIWSIEISPGRKARR